MMPRIPQLVQFHPNLLAEQLHTPDASHRFRI
jgi:hypothetical protein